MDWEQIHRGLIANDESAWQALHETLTAGQMRWFIQAQWRDNFGRDHAQDVLCVLFKSDLTRVQNLKGYVCGTIKRLAMVQRQHRKAFDRYRASMDLAENMAAPGNVLNELIESQEYARKKEKLSKLIDERLNTSEKQAIHLVVNNKQARDFTKFGFTYRQGQNWKYQATKKLIAAFREEKKAA